jgi:hypothetical protein
MTLWLLLHVPTWILGVGTIVGLPILAAVACVVVRRRFPALADGENNEVTGVVISILGGIYGIVLAFVIVVLWEQFQAAQNLVQSEAVNVAQIVRDAGAFPEPARGSVVRSAGDYVHSVVEQEWPRMSSGIDSRSTREALDRLYGAVVAYEPQTQVEQAFYAEIAGKLDEIVFSRRQRVHQATYELPPVLEALIGFGALLMIAVMYFFGTRSTRIHVFMSAAVAALLAFNLLLVLLLEHPFAGEVAVRSTPFRQGVLAQFWPDGQASARP